MNTKTFVLPMPQKVEISYQKLNSTHEETYQIVPIEVSGNSITAYAYKHGIRKFRFDRIKEVKFHHS